MARLSLDPPEAQPWRVSVSRRFPEVSPDAEALILRLVREGSADLQRRPWLVHVADWHALESSEQRLIVSARADARAYLERRSTRSPPRGGGRRTARRGGKPSAGRRPPRSSPQQDYSERRLRWLRSRVGTYDSAAGWERSAWREAYDRRHFPRHTAVAAGLVTLWLSRRWTDSWALSLVVLVAVGLATAAAERALVARTAKHFLILFAEAREQSRYIPADVRRRVLERDGYACRFCRSTEDLHIDHIDAHSRGGARELGNLQTLCAHCNISKGARSNRAARRRLARRWWTRLQARAR